MLNYFPVPDKVKRPLFVLPTDGSMPPVQMCAQRVPFSLRISEELDRVINQRILELLQPCYAQTKSSKMMALLKCSLITKLYQIPAVNDVLASLKKGEIFFTKLDLEQAYQQSLVAEASEKLQTTIYS
ncbi:hypothetical protein T4E_3270 [Trichinella pseudospiralis]|uniref:Reverse transcriptase domain-containing protein n=1 Tax=Trichinella pseudospiralis TaxID=6337 RepID=A0A0V0YNL6_TRIPS|nr:hypothetical protein T4E_3270 [Trichinella pseudospiralis]